MAATFGVRPGSDVTEGSARERGSWRLSLLSPQQQSKTVPSMLLHNDEVGTLDRWVGFKNRIKKAAINFGKQKRWQERQEEAQVLKKLNQITANLDRATAGELADYEALKARLAKLHNSKCQAAALRAKVDDLMQGEKYSAYFLGLEKRKQEKQMITALLDTEGKIKTEKDEIEKIAVNFYCELF